MRKPQRRRRAKVPATEAGMRGGWRSMRPLWAALRLYALWTAATWVFEGRVDTFRRPEAARDRMVYAFVVSLVLGMGCAYVLLLGGQVPDSGNAGRSGRRAVSSVAAGVLLGLGSYVAQGGPSGELRVVGNAYAQVLVVSAAEVMVCWAVLANAVQAGAVSAGCTRAWAAALAGIVASLLFGLHHFAHSPPFDRLPMVALLSAVGLLTSAFFLVTRSVPGTVLFHNFLGTFGVVRALAEADALQAYRQWQPPLLATAALTLAVLAAGETMLARAAKGSRATRRPWSRR